jgi:hypothetical protein
MKNLKLLFLTLFSVISLTLFSQVQVNTTSTSGPNVCDGMAALDSSNVVTISNIVWQGMGMIINQGSYFVNFLCPGTYSVTFLSNNTPVTLTFTITVGCQGFGITTTHTNSSTVTSCDGMITVNVNGGTAPYTYIWGTGTPITSNTATNLCPGNYVIEVIDANLCSDFTNVDILDSAQTVGDTLIINGGSGCSPSTGTETVVLEDCVLDYNAVDTAFISLITYPTNPMDSLEVVWSVIDTNNVLMSNYTTYYTGLNTGCNELQFVLYCFQKSTNVKTIVMSSSVNVEFVGIKELTGNNKQLVSVTDLLGRETKVQPNKLLIYTYSDGTKEIRYINE